MKQQNIMDFIQNKTIDSLLLSGDQPHFPELCTFFSEHIYMNVKNLFVSKFLMKMSHISCLKGYNCDVNIQLRDIHVIDDKSRVSKRYHVYIGMNNLHK